LAVRVTSLVDGERLVWLAADPAGFPVGTALLTLSTKSGREHLGQVAIDVHPAERRRGTGSSLLDLALAAAAGRRCVVADAEAGSAGELFLVARGFRKVLTLVFARLPLARAEIVAGAAVAGYRVVSWDAEGPESLAETFVASRRAMDDMPMEDADFSAGTWDLARVRAAERAVADRGDLLHVVAAVHEPTGEIAGFTELVVPGDGTGDAQHYGTGVLPEHRGRGLGRWLKAEAIRQARERYPDLGGLLTDTAESNKAMRKINADLGYVPTRTMVTYQLLLTV
jgi:GNAT superfamily N-acetyltransferase